MTATDAEISKPEGGFFIWIKLPTGTDTTELAKWAAEASVEWRPGTGFMPNGGGEEFARLAYSYESVAEVLRRRPGVREGDPPVDAVAVVAPGPRA